MSSSEIARALLSIKAIGLDLKEPRNFSAGMKAPTYVDNRAVLSHPEQRNSIIGGFIEAIINNGLDFDVIAGIETAGIPHSSILSDRLEKPAVFVRKKAKEHGTKSRVEGGNVSGKKVLLIEDHVTTGESSLSGVEALREMGGIVAVCLSITSYEFQEGREAFEKAGVQLITLTTFFEILKIAEEMSMISEGKKKEIEEWLQDPWQWTANH